MPRSKAPSNLASMWWDTAFKLWQTAVAAPQVVAHRTTRMARAGAIPSTRDRKEFTRMAQEKIEAAHGAARDMTLEMYKINQQMAQSAVQQWTRAWIAATTPGSRRAAEPLTPVVSPMQAAAITSRVMAKGLAPVHKRATANAKRLRAKKRR